MLLLAVKLSEYISQGASSLSDSDVLAFRTHAIPEITRKMLTTEHEVDGELLKVTRLLIRIAVEYDDFIRSSTITQPTKEAIFALKYFLEENDAIPDTEEEIGYKDDLMIGIAALKSHRPELRAFADACGQAWYWD